MPPRYQMTRRSLAEIVLYDYYQRLLSHKMCVEALMKIGYTKEQALRMLAKVDAMITGP